MDKKDVENIARLQIELTEKYSDRLEMMEKVIHQRIDEYIDLYNEAVKRLMEEEQQTEGGGESGWNN